MKILISTDIFKSTTSRELIPLECSNCLSIFYKEKHYINKSIKNPNHSRLKFCSRKCQFLARTLKRLITYCTFCKKELSLLPRAVKQRNFCSRTCYNNNRIKEIKPKLIKPVKIIKEKKFCICSKQLLNSNITGMCKTCYIISDRAMEQRGRSFAKTRKYKINPFTQEQFYLIGNQEELFFDLCVKHSIQFLKPKPIKYLDLNNKSHLYFPDFYLPHLNSLIEIKGYYSDEDKIKMKLIYKQYPNIALVILRKHEIIEFVNYLIS